MMKRQFRILAFGLLLVAALSMSGCILFPGYRKAAFGLAEALVKMPGAITKRIDATTSNYIAPRSSNAVIASLQGIYTPVRDNYNEIANNAIEFTRDLLASIDLELFGNRRLVNYLEENGEFVFNDGSQAWQITQTGTVYTVAGWEKVAGVWYPTIYITFTQDGDHLFGEVVAIDTPEDSDSPTYRIVFDNADADFQGAMTTELEAVNLDYSNISEFNIPTKLWLRAYAQGEVFQIATSVYYTDVNLEDNQDIQPYLMGLIEDPLNAPYVPDELGITGLYQYRGTFQVNAEVDRGMIDLALVPGYTDPATTDEFTEYSVGALWKEAIAEWIRGDAALLDAINAAAGSDLHALSITDEIFTVLVNYQATLGAGESDDLDNILFVVLLTNPAYFDNQFDDSFVGTAELNTPDWASELPNVTPLDIERDQLTMPNLTVDFTGTGMTAEPPAATPL